MRETRFVDRDGSCRKVHISNVNENLCIESDKHLPIQRPLKSGDSIVFMNTYNNTSVVLSYC